MHGDSGSSSGKRLRQVAIPDGARHGFTWTDAADGTRRQWRHLHDQPLFADRVEVRL